MADLCMWPYPDIKQCSCRRDFMFYFNFVSCIMPISPIECYQSLDLQRLPYICLTYIDLQSLCHWVHLKLHVLQKCIPPSRGWAVLHLHLGRDPNLHHKFQCMMICWPSLIPWANGQFLYQPQKYYPCFNTPLNVKKKQYIMEG